MWPKLGGSNPDVEEHVLYGFTHEFLEQVKQVYGGKNLGIWLLDEGGILTGRRHCRSS